MHEAVPADVEAVAAQVIDAGLKVHRALGPGLLESVYEQCLAHEIISRGLNARRQVALPVVYESVVIDAGYRIDILVEDLVVVEIKATEGTSRLHEAQLLTYLRLSGKRLGFLMNFNVELFRDATGFDGESSDFVPFVSFVYFVLNCRS